MLSRKSVGCKSVEIVGAKEVRRTRGELGGGLWDLSWGER